MPERAMSRAKSRSFRVPLLGVARRVEGLKRRHVRVVASALLVGMNACDSVPPTSQVSPKVTVDGIAIRQVPDTLDAGQTVTFIPALRSGGTEVENTGAVRWTSSDSLALTIDSLTGVGLAKNVTAPTTVTVTARLDSLRATAKLVVFPKVPGVKILMSSSVAVGRAVAPTVLLNTLQGEPFTQQPAGSAFTQPIAGWGARFTSQNPAVLRVDSDGTLSGVASGASRVTVDLHGARDSLVVTVLPGYSLTFLPGTDGLRVVDVNDSGDIVAILSAPLQGKLIRGGQQTALGSCNVLGINNGGQVLCSTGVYDNGAFTDLFGTGAFQGFASGIDEKGFVFGLLTKPDSLRGRAFAWNSGTIDVYPLLGTYGLVSTGHVAAGGSGIGLVPETLVPHAVPAVLRPIGQATYLQGVGSKYSDRVANDINDAENVVGTVDGRAKLWLKSDGYKGQFLDTGLSTATAISEANDIVGGGPQGAFVWSGGRYVVLSDAVAEGGWSFSNSPVISRNGTIAVTGTNVDGRKGIVLVKLQ